MGNMIKIQKLFNDEFNFSELQVVTKKYIKKILEESPDEFFFDFTDDKSKIQELRIMHLEYDFTKLIINKEWSSPTFLLKYNLYKQASPMPSYTYEVEYNLIGDFLDEYFLKY